MPLNETVNLNITEAQRQISVLEGQLDQLARPITVPVTVTGGGELEGIRRELDSSEGAVSELNRELDQTDDALRGVGTQAARTGTDLDTAGRKGVTAFGSLRSTVGALGGTLVAFAGASALGSFLSESVTAASSLEQSVGALDAVFGDLGDEVAAFGDIADQSVGLAASQFNQLASVLGSQLQTFGFNVEDAAEETQNLIGLASDLAATFGGPVSQAVEAISSLLRGEVNPIERYGVAMNEAAIQARTLEDGLANTAGELTFQDKTMARLAILYEQTANAQGQFADEANTTAGQVERLNAEFENTQAIIGEALVPAVQAALPILADFATAAGVIGVQLGVLFGTVDQAEGRLQTFSIQSGLAADSAGLLAASVLELQANFEQVGEDTALGASETEEFVAQVEALAEAWDGSAQEAQFLIDNLDFLIDRFGLTEEGADTLRAALERAIVTDFATQEDAALIDNLARSIDHVGVAVDESLPSLTRFGESLDGLPDGADAFNSIVNGIEDEFNRLPGIFGIVSDALETAEGDAITKAADFLDNIRQEFEDQRLFEDNIEAARALGLDNLVTAAEEFGIEFAPVLADALANPTLAAEIDSEFDTFMADRAQNAYQALATALLAEFSAAPLQVLLDVDVVLGNVKLPGAGSLADNLIIPGTGSISNTGSSGGSGANVFSVVNEFTGFTPSSTDLAKASMITSSIIKSNVT